VVRVEWLEVVEDAVDVVEAVVEVDILEIS
jgi:hypothetical protein